MPRRLLVVGVAVLVLCCLAPQTGLAAPAAPGFTIGSSAEPTIFSSEIQEQEKYDVSEVPEPEEEELNYGKALSANRSAQYRLTVTNSGNRPTDGSPVTVVDTLPAGLTATAITGRRLGEHPTPLGGRGHFMNCVLATLTCVYPRVLAPGDVLYVDVLASVAPGTKGPVTASAEVSGGGAPPAFTSESNAVGTATESTTVPYGLETFSTEVRGLDGLTDTQAGDHPYEENTSFTVNTTAQGATEHQKDVVVDLPPGFLGNPDAIAKCPQYLVGLSLSINEVGGKALVEPCPPASQIGVAEVGILGGIAGKTEVSPIYNVVPDKSFPAEFMFGVNGIPVTLYATVTPKTNYGVRVIVPDVTSRAAVTSVSVTFFGTPTQDRNMYNKLPVSANSGVTPVAFLANPTGCSASPSVATIASDSWEHPGSWVADGSPPFGSPNLSDPNWRTASAVVYPELGGCDLLQFDPTVTVAPTTTQADEPSGLTVDLLVPQAAQMAPNLITPELKNVTVTFPPGFSLSPSAADGLQACGEAQIDLSSDAAGSCPDASILGTVKVKTPLLAEPLEGHLFLGVPGCGQPGEAVCSAADAADGNMFHLFIEAAGSGVFVKLAGHSYVNATTGQVTSTFDNNPQVPFSDFQLSLKGGLRAPLATPQSCGTYTTTTDFTPWSTPITPDATPFSSFNVDWDGNGGACPAIPPLNPGFSAGTSNPNAGQFSPLTLTFSREDREQDLSGIQVRTPPGLLGGLSGIPLCGEPQASLGTCSAASRIGTMTVAAGAGSHPFYERGSLYLTGPYKGAPFGLSIVVPTIAGPFNLGNVVVRAQINVDPHTTALTVTSDSLPQVIDGIPLRLRTANVTVDRPGFIFNPTNCAQQQITATISGAQGAQAHVATPFAVAGCAGLPFAPKFSVSTSGKTSRVNGASLDARLIYPKGAQSNIARVKVALPKQLPSRLTTLQKACLAATFEANPASCPKGAIVGIARATSPVLPVTLTGPAYFVSHGGEAFPNLIVVLQGYGVRIDLIGDTFINKAGITSSTFTNVPDVQVNSFELYLPQGPDSALAANGNLCKSKLVMPTSFIAQDGAQLKQNTKITVTGCGATASRAKRARKARRAGNARQARRTGRAQAAGRRRGHGGSN
jgi:uncharacterized repeat protein (TIGR01451 family)